MPSRAAVFTISPAVKSRSRTFAASVPVPVTSARSGYLSILRNRDPVDAAITNMYWPLTAEDDDRDFRLVVTKIYGITLVTDSLRAELPVPPPEEMALTIAFKA